MDAQARYDELADDLAARNHDVTLGKMFGMPCVKRSGKAVAGFWQGGRAQAFWVNQLGPLAGGGSHRAEPGSATA